MDPPEVSGKAGGIAADDSLEHYAVRLAFVSPSIGIGFRFFSLVLRAI
jgi:hypothetical protein